jgi:hypothetical protein
MKKTYHGSCHCGAVRFEADIELRKDTTRCNCSTCTKARAWFAIMKTDGFHMIAGADALADYQWTPPGKPRPNLHYRFCTTCGVRAFAQGEQEAMQPHRFASDDEWMALTQSSGSGRNRTRGGVRSY